MVNDIVLFQQNGVKITKFNIKPPEVRYHGHTAKTYNSSVLVIIVLLIPQIQEPY